MRNVTSNPFAFGALGPSSAEMIEAAQDAVGAMVANSARVTLTYVDATPSLTADLVAGSVTYVYLQDVSAASRVLGRGSAGGAGDVQELTLGASLVMNGAAIERAALTGDVTAAQNGNATTIANDAVTFAKMQNSAAAGLSVVGRSTNSAGDFAEIAAGADGQVLRRGSSSSLAFGTLLSSSFADGTIAAARMTATASQRLFGRNTAGSGNGEEVTLSQVLDWAGATNGFVLYRSGGVWTANTPNTAGLVDLTSSQTITGAKTFSLPSPLHITSSASNGEVVNITNTDASNTGCQMIFYKNSASPDVNDAIFGLRMDGNDSVGTRTVFGRLDVLINDPTNGSEDGLWRVNTCVAGTLITNLFVGAGLYMNGASGGDQGSGTINATAVYDDAVLLCAPLNPDMTQEDWDALTVSSETVEEEYVKTIRQEVLSQNPLERALKWATFGLVQLGRKEVRAVEVPGTRAVEVVSVGKKQHITAKRHFRMLAEGFDPADPAKYFARMRADKAVPGLMTVDEWRERMITHGPVDKPSIAERNERTFLAIDYLAVLCEAQQAQIDALTARVAALEAAT